MTKRDLTTWFCKILALTGLVNSGFGVVRSGLLSIFVNWGSLRDFAVQLFYPALSCGFYLFVWFFAFGIATEMMTPREREEPLQSSAELASLLLRCAGLWILLSASISFGPTFLFWVFGQVVNRTPVSLGKASSISDGIMMANLIVGFAQSVFGFLLAFAPRILASFRR